ncbi:MAG: hypothetical protein ACXWID_13855 [Pyrinomonadaceae bacterium]
MAISRSDSARGVFDWLGRNISTLFSLVGILVTVYFAAFYVPSYLKEAQQEKIRTMNASLIGSIQDSLYNEQDIQRSDVEALIHGKELKYNLQYPFSVDELLVQVEESFYDNKFIPYEKRKVIVNKIKLLRGQTSSTPNPTPPDASVIRKLSGLPLTAVLAVLSTLVSALGLYSLYSRAKIEKEIEVEQAVNAEADQIAEAVKTGFDYEHLVEAAIRDLKMEYESVGGADAGYDFLIKTPKGNLYIEAKYSSRLRLPSAALQFFGARAARFQGHAVLVTNAPPPPFAIDTIDKLNELNRFKTYVVIGQTREMITEGLGKIIQGLGDEDNV